MATTLKEQLIARMNELGIEPKRSMGQNFLIDHYVVAEIMKAVDSITHNRIVEVGPGLGALTEQLQKRPARRTLIELDRKFAKYWRDLGEEVIEDDALQANWFKLELPTPTLLVSNLPYQIASRLVLDRSLGPAVVTDMVLMFQKEVAERMQAEPRTGDYGFLTIVAQSFWSISTVVDASPESFYPIPQVASRVMHFKRKPNVSGLDQKFFDFVKESFQFRRKLLTKNLQRHGPPVKAQLTAMGLRETARPEELTVEQFHQLYHSLYGN